MTFDTLSGGNVPVLIGIIALAYFIRGVSGFGSGLIAIPLLALYLPLQVAMPTVAILDNVAAAGHGLRHRDSIAWRELLPLVPITLLGVVAGVYLLNNVDTAMLQKGMGGFLLLYAIYMLSGLLPQRKRPLGQALPFALVGGLISTLFGTGGPFYVIYLHLRNHGKLEFRATVAMIFLMDGTIRLLGYLFTGFLDAATLLATGIALPVMLISMRIGNYFHSRLSQNRVQRLISLLLVTSGSLLMFR